MKELASTWAQKRDHVLEIGGGTCSCAESSRIHQATLAGKESEAEDAATDLEAPRGDVLVRHTVTGEVEDRPEENCGESGVAGSAGRCAGRDMKRNDHDRFVASAQRPAQDPSCSPAVAGP